MRHPTKSEFRWLALIGLGVIVVAAMLEHFRIPQPAEETANALDWNYYGSPLPHQALFSLCGLLVIGFVVGGIGFLCFQAWSRWFIIGCFLGQFLLSPFLGLYVARAFPDTLGQIGGFLFLVPFVLSFFAPCSGYFGSQEAQPTAPPNGGPATRLGSSGVTEGPPSVSGSFGLNMSAPGTRRWIVIVSLTIVVLASVVVLPIAPMCRDCAYVCEYTGSRKGSREWLLGIETGAWYKESPMEAFIRQNFPSKLEHQWTSYAGTGRNIFGVALTRGHGSPGPILQLPIDLLAEYSAVASPTEMKHLYDTMRTGSEIDKKAIPDQVFQTVMDRKGKTEQ